MSRWAISYINFFNNDLLMGVIEATNQIDAMQEALIIFGEWNKNDIPDNIDDPEDFKQFCFNCDCMVGAISID